MNKMKTLKSLLWLSAFLLCIASCSKEEVTEKIMEVPEGKVPVFTEIIVDGVVQTNSRASNEAGYTTGDGLYDEGDPVNVTAVANDGYELVKFYDKSGDARYQDKSSYSFPAEVPQTFKAEFARKYTISVSASPTAGGSVSGGGVYRNGKSCTLAATANAGYVFDGWYEGSTKLSSNTSYSFTVSSNRTITGRFKEQQFMMVGDKYILTPQGVSKIDIDKVFWQAIAYGNGRYVVVGNQGAVISSTDGVTWTAPKYLGSSYHVWSDLIYINGQFVVVGTHALGANEGYIVSSTDGINWTAVKTVGTSGWSAITYGNGKFVAVGYDGYITTSTDGISWTTPTTSGNNSWKFVTYGNGKYVAGGWNGYTANSTDGITWNTKWVFSDGSNVLCAAYGQGKFLFLSNSYSAISSDGVNWTKQKKQSHLSERSMTYGGGMFVAVGSSGKISMSKDGINWTTAETVKDNSGNELNIQLECVRCAP